MKFLAWLLFIGVLLVFTSVMLNIKRFKGTLILQLNNSHSVSGFCNAEKRVCVFDVWLVACVAGVYWGVNCICFCNVEERVCVFDVWLVACLILCSPNGLLLTSFSSHLDSDVTHKIISTITLSLFLCKITVGL